MTLKINYIAHLSPLRYNGGGEMILRRLVETGLERGHRFAYTTAAPRQRDFFAEADITLLADVFNCPQGVRKLPRKILEQIVDSGRYIHFDNAYVDVCNLGYLPCSGENVSCCSWKKGMLLYQRLLSGDFSRDCFQERTLVRNMYRNSLVNVFLSPLHRDIVSTMLRLENKASYILKPLIDEKLFFNRHGERDLEYLFVGVICEAKGLEEMRRRFRNTDIHLIGKIAAGERLDFGHYLGTIPYDQVPAYMNRARNFVFLPRWPEPQGRVVVEAAMSGCRLITNGNVGACSFPFDISRPENFRRAEQEFWEEVERRVGR